MHILCPHCRNPVEVIKLSSREELACPTCGSTFRVETDSTLGWEGKAGQKLGKYELLGMVGQGAFGTVYKARDAELDRVVAIKVPRAGLLAGTQDLDRFLREARSVAQLRHPSIVTVHDVGQAGGVPYLVTDFVEGITLTDLLSARRPSFRESAELIANVADALQYAHEHGVVHRDVKPSNIMIGADRAAFVMDFGLAKRDGGEITMTMEGQVLGTPAYMPPEQARGEGHDVDARGDVYSLGVILYQLLTGELPFRGTERMLLHQVLNDEPRAPRSLNDAIPRDLETIALKAMMKEPARRYATARDLADDLRRWLKGEAILARPVGRVERAARWAKRNPVVAALTVGVGLSLLVGAVVSAYFAVDASGHAEQARKNEQTAKTNEAAAINARNELAGKVDDLRTSITRSWLRPLEGQRLDPLRDSEIEALWELASSADEELRLRFLREGLRDPVTRRRLTDRREYVVQAAAGVDSRRRAAVERVLYERLQNEGNPLDEQADLALLLAQLGVEDRARAGTVVAALIGVMGRTRDRDQLSEVSEAVAALAPRLGDQEARASAALLLQVMGQSADANELTILVTSLTAVTARLDASKEAQALNGRAAALMLEAMTNTTDSGDLLTFANNLPSTSLEPKAASRVHGRAAVYVIHLMNQTTDRNELAALTNGVPPLSVPLQAQEASAAAELLLHQMSMTTEPDRLSWLGQGLSSVAARLAAREAAAVQGRACVFLARAVRQTNNGSEAQFLVQNMAMLAQPAEKEADEAAAILLDKMDQATDPVLLVHAANGLSILAPRLEAKQAAARCGRAAALLTQALSKAADANGVQCSAQGLELLRSFLDANDASLAAAALIHSLSKLTNENELAAPSGALVALASRLGAKEASDAAKLLLQTMGETTHPTTLRYLTWDLSEVLSRLDRKADADGASQAAELLLSALTRTTNAGDLRSLADALSWMLAHREAPEAIAAARRAAAHLGRTLRQTKDPADVVLLTVGLSALAPSLGATDAREAAASILQAMRQATNNNPLRDLAIALPSLAARLQPNEAAGVCNPAVVILARAMTKTTYLAELQGLVNGVTSLAPFVDAPTAAEVVGTLLPLSKGNNPFLLAAILPSLQELAPRLKVQNARESVTQFLQTMGKTTNPMTQSYQAQAVAALSSRLEDKEATAACTQAAVLLFLALKKERNVNVWNTLVQGVSALAPRLEAKEAREAAALLLQAIGTNVGITNSTNEAVAGTLWLLSSRQGANDGGAGAALLLQAMSKTTSGNSLGPLGHSLAAVTTYVEPADRRRRLASLLAPVRLSDDGYTGLTVAAVLRPALEPLPCRLSTQQLVELLKQPVCVGDARRVVLDHLGNRHHRTFADQWEFVRFAEEQKLELDFTSPPKRP